MKNYSIDEIIGIYEKSGELMYEATLLGDYKTNNKEGKRLISIFKMFEKNLDFGKKCIDKLFESSNVVVKIEAASYCLALNYNTEYAVSVLRNVALESKNDIFGFNAEMIINEWEKNGSLKLY